jgi:translocator protein
MSTTTGNKATNNAEASPTDTPASPSSTMDASSRRTNALGALPWINVVSYLINVAVTYGVGVAGFLDLPSNSVVSEKYQTIVTPIGWAFAIWGIIFVSQGIWALLQLLVYTGRLPELYVETIRTVQCYYVLVVATQVAWTLLFANEWIIGSAVMMVCILWNLGIIVFSLARQDRINQQDEDADITTRGMSSLALSAGKYLLLQFPFAIHFGWILAATVVNVNVVLVAKGLDTNILFYGAVAGLVGLVLVALYLAIGQGFVTVPLVVVWALFGVYSELSAPKEIIALVFSEKELQGVRVGALVSMTVLVLSVAFAIFRKLRESMTTERSGESVYLRANE